MTSLWEALKNNKQPVQKQAEYSFASPGFIKVFEKTAALHGMNADEISHMLDELETSYCEQSRD